MVIIPLYNLINEIHESYRFYYFVGQRQDEWNCAFLYTRADLNAYAIGRTLDKSAAAGPDRLFGTICLSTYAIYKIAFKRLHSDTTSLSFYGEYDIEPEVSEEEAEEVLQIVRGYNKDHRPECKQVVIGKIVNEHGMPLASLNMDGNTSDVEWNQKALELVGQMDAGQLNEGIYVADSIFFFKQKTAYEITV
nr:hypothetical protein [Candidatus Hakubella thermalkaliphila]